MHSTDFFHPMHIQAHRQLLAYACGRQISCRCGQLLDVSNAVMIETDIEDEYVGTYCADCYDECIKGKFPQYNLDVLDGRDIAAGYTPVNGDNV